MANDQVRETLEREQRTEDSRKRAFEKFMATDVTKLMVSMVPASNPPEALETLLKAAFKAGSDSGAGEVVGEMIGAMLKAPRRDDNGPFGSGRY